MELSPEQHQLLLRLQAADGAAKLSALKTKLRVADRRELIDANLIEEGRAARSVMLTLTEKGRQVLAANPTGPPKPSRQTPLKPERRFPFPAHRVFMYRLAFARVGHPIEGLSKALPAKQRKLLVDEKWVECRLVRRKLECELTDAGWQWVEGHLADGIGGNPAGDALGDVLARLQIFLTANDLRLVDLLRANPIVIKGQSASESESSRPSELTAANGNSASASSAHSDPTGKIPPEKTAPGMLPQAIQAACRKLAHSNVSRHVKLADLRPALSEWNRSAVDSALTEMALAGQIKLVPMDDPREREPRDVAAAWFTPAGEARHLINLLDD